VGGPYATNAGPPDAASPAHHVLQGNEAGGRFRQGPASGGIKGGTPACSEG